MLNVPSTTPLERTLYELRVPAPKPSTFDTGVALASSCCEMTGLPAALFKFQVRLMGAAPSVRLAMLMPVIEPPELETAPLNDPASTVVDSRFPDESKVIVPEVSVVAAPVPPVAEAGRLME